MPSIYGMSAIGGGFLIVGIIIWFLVRNAKKQGIAEQLARDSKVVAETESAIHQVQDEHRDPAETKKRLKGGTF